MNPKLILCLALVLSGGLFGCESPPASRVDTQRQHLTVIYQDKTRPLAERVAAFDSLLETFKTGTPRAILNKYISPEGTTTSRLTPGESTFILHLEAPDGSDRWIPLRGEEYDKEVIEY
jgi:hypothetical protein